MDAMPQVERFPANVAGRDFIVGDVHGCVAQLVILLQDVKFDRAVDRLFSVGDLIDRGPDSPSALALLYEPWFHAVRGNHEQMLATVIDQPTARHWDWWTQNGGAWARCERAATLRLYADLVNALPLAIVVGDGPERFNVMHGEFFGTDDGLDSGDFAPHVAMAMLWGRDLINGKAVPPREGLSVTYVGHTPVRTPFCAFSHHYLDTGAGHRTRDARLTLYQHGVGEAASIRTWDAFAPTLAW
ncbi:metallophosphoesterase [Burkholderia pseudomallei]|uniref:metallophosphoesterase n=1 Tax=Burkholderia pseudomallei TaxID=28450 RepID=UPI00015F7D23|nr:metallophosphoesterase [Burkholderia pseudomallei Pasteur 52237]MWA16561.1 metallophosphoesterase [Burkholderia pseudomallei]